MMLYILLCNILFIPVIYSGSNRTINTILNPEKVLNQTSSHKEIPSQPKLMLSEGGSVLPDTSSLTLPKKNVILPNLEEEFGTKRDKPVARRNGVGDPIKNNLILNNSSQLIKNDSTELTVKNSANEAVATANKNVFHINIPTNTIPMNGKDKVVVESTTIIAHNGSKLKDMSGSLNNIKSQNASSEEINKLKIHKKPLILSYEALDNMDESQQLNIPAMQSSSKTLVNDQLPSPNADSNKVYPKSASKHPGMIMPVVITILVVPMFAVLGYMALRRGQEAWKNRHYKRMDFLLDGMYND